MKLSYPNLSDFDLEKILAWGWFAFTMRAFSTFCWRIRALDRKMKASWCMVSPSDNRIPWCSINLGTVLKRLSNSSKRADSSILCSLWLPGWISFHKCHECHKCQNRDMANVGIIKGEHCSGGSMAWNGKGYMSPPPAAAFSWPGFCASSKLFAALNPSSAFIACPIVTTNFHPQHNELPPTTTSSSRRFCSRRVILASFWGFGSCACFSLAHIWITHLRNCQQFGPGATAFSCPSSSCACTLPRKSLRLANARHLLTTL